MAITPSTYETYLQDCLTAMEGGSYSVARQKLALAKVAACNLPNVSIAGRSVSRQDAFKQLEAVESAINAHERAAAGAGAVQLVPLSMGRPG